MTAELPKVVWTSPDGNLRAVFRWVDSDGEPAIEVESLEKDAMGAPIWVDRRPEQWVDEIIADLSGVKWREAKA